MDSIMQTVAKNVIFIKNLTCFDKTKQYWDVHSDTCVSSGTWEAEQGGSQYVHS